MKVNWNLNQFDKKPLSRYFSSLQELMVVEARSNDYYSHEKPIGFATRRKMHQSLMCTNKSVISFFFYEIEIILVGWLVVHIFSTIGIKIYRIFFLVEWDTIFAKWCRQWCEHALELMILLSRKKIRLKRANYFRISCMYFAIGLCCFAHAYLLHTETDQLLFFRTTLNRNAFATQNRYSSVELYYQNSPQPHWFLRFWQMDLYTFLSIFYLFYFLKQSHFYSMFWQK